ncbi:MAG: hypothetical protein ACD_19C00337G0001 [uncultured bacterium]|nr:MAG: hypothetical protein ACD_19C00337G0001 [uncultured bacterium]
MPGLDQTGPQGQGPMTGKGKGSCKKGSMRMKRGFGRCCNGMGRGAGRSFGWNHVSQTKEEKIEDIQTYKQELQEEIENMDTQLADLQKQE